MPPIPNLTPLQKRDLPTLPYMTQATMRPRVENIAAATDTLRLSIGAAKFSPSLCGDLQAVLEVLQQYGVHATVKTQPSTNSYLAQVAVPDLPAPITGVLDFHHGACTDVNPVVAVLYAFHQARGGTFLEEEWPQ